MIEGFTHFSLQYSEATVMQHPFHGVIVSEETTTQPLSRRAAIGTMVFAAAGVMGAARTASAQIATTRAIGEEGAVQPPAVATTLAIGEEGALTEAINEAGAPTTRALGEEGAAAVTTEPFGEEAGRVTSKAVPGLEDGVGGDPNVTTKALREEGAVQPPVATTLAIGEEGARPPLTKARGEDGGAQPGLPVRVQPGQKQLTDKQLQGVWKDLSDKDVGKALQASAVLYGAKDSVSFLKGNLKLDAPRVERKQVMSLLVLLDSNDFAAREKAEEALVALGVGVLPLVKITMTTTNSVEVRMRTTRIVEKLQSLPEVSQVRRGIEVLVALQTPEAKDVLAALARGGDTDLVADLARDAIKRGR
jgi:hypothetical protein